MNSNVKRWLCTAGTSCLVLGMIVFGGASGLAQDSPAGEGGPFPVDLHSGSCEDPLTEPAYDGGNLDWVAEGAADEDAAALLGDDGLLNEDDEGFLAADVDGDGIAEVGIDADGNGTLDDAEILGRDENRDNALDEGEIGGAVPADPMQGALKAEADIDADGEELLNEGPYVVIVHQSEEEYTTYLACGEIRDLDLEDDEVIVPLRPVGNSQYFGFARIPRDSGELDTYLFRGLAGQGVTAAPTPASIPPTNTPVQTNTPPPPPPTNTPVPTAVITETEVVEVTQVVTETEVVPAPTATAEAQQ